MSKDFYSERLKIKIEKIINELDKEENKTDHEIQQLLNYRDLLFTVECIEKGKGE